LARKAAEKGLSKRSGKVEHDAASLITFSTVITGLAVELEIVDKAVLEYHSPNAGEAIPEFHKLNVEGDYFSVSINPLFNNLQSGACGYVLSGKKTPFLRFTNDRRASTPMNIEDSLYLAPTPKPEGESSDDGTEHWEDHHEEDAEHHEEGNEDDDEDYHEGESSAGATEATSGTSATTSGGETP
jgi:hypothetical protein